MSFIIFDKGDGTYHTGGGNWSRIQARAERYESDAEAITALDDVDCDELLRDRLMVVVAREDTQP